MKCPVEFRKFSLARVYARCARGVLCLAQSNHSSCRLSGVASSQDGLKRKNQREEYYTYSLRSYVYNTLPYSPFPWERLTVRPLRHTIAVDTLSQARKSGDFRLRRYWDGKTFTRLETGERKHCRSRSVHARQDGMGAGVGDGSSVGMESNGRTQCRGTGAPASIPEQGRQAGGFRFMRVLEMSPVPVRCRVFRSRWNFGFSGVWSKLFKASGNVIE